MPVGAASRAVAGLVIGDRHILRVVGDIRSGAAEDLAVVEGYGLAFRLRVFRRAVDDGRPEIAAERTVLGVAFTRKLDVLRRVKTEAVYAAVDTILQQIQHLCLDIGVLCFQFRHALMMLRDVVTAVVVDPFRGIKEIIGILHIRSYAGVQMRVQTR